VLSSHYFDAYGLGFSSPSSINPTPWGYGAQSGYYTDGETSLVLLTNRYYDPARARFLTRDPIGLVGGTNEPLSTPAERPYGAGRGSKYQGQIGPTASRIHTDVK
jgi:RHS repeat-associated protein